MAAKKATLVIITLPKNGISVFKDCVQFEKAELIDFDLFESSNIKDHQTAWTYKATNKDSEYLGLNIKISIMSGVGNITAPYNKVFAGIPREASESDKIKLVSNISKFIIPNKFKGLVSKNGRVAPDYIIDEKALRAVVKKIIGK